MPEQNRTIAEAKKQHDEFMNLLKIGAHLDESILPFEEPSVSYFHLTPVCEDGTPITK